MEPLLPTVDTACNIHGLLSTSCGLWFNDYGAIDVGIV